MLLAVVSDAPFAHGEDPEILHLQGGEQLSGISRGFADGMLRWELPQGSELTLPLEAIDRIEYSSVDSAVPLAPVETLDPSLDASDAEEDLNGRFQPFHSTIDVFEHSADRALEVADNWTERIEVGGRLLDGNSNEDFFNLSATLERQVENRFAQFEFGGQYGQSDGDPNTNRWFGNSNFDFDHEGNWICFISTKNEFDEFENLDYRGTFSTGMGYRFYNEDDKRLILRVGPAATYEKFHAPAKTRTTPDLLGEIELRWPIFERTSIEHKTTVHPSMADVNVFRLVSNYGLLVHLDEDSAWSLKIGTRHEYNARPNQDRKPSDYTTSLQLVYTRK